jgi:nucleoside-diphosphate-sugar epimerase
MNILLIGGTGIISSDVTELCVRKGYRVTLLNRGSRPLLVSGVTQITCDMSDEAAVADILRNQYFDVVANFIVYTRAQAERDIRLFTGKAGQYIFVSSASVYEKRPGLITECAPLHNPYWKYSRDKIECENVYMDAYRSAGFPVTIVRPSHTYSARNVPVSIHGKNGSWQVLKRMREGKPVLVQGDGTSLWTMTHAADFARGFTGLMGNPRAVGEAVHITSDEVLTWDEVYNHIGAALGVKPVLLHMPSDFLSACAPEDFTGRLHGDKSVCATFDNSKIKRLAPGFFAETPFGEGVRHSVKFMLNNPEQQQEDAVFDRFCDTVAGAWDAALGWFKNEMGGVVRLFS